MQQLAIPVDIQPREIARKPSLAAAIELCAEVGGKEPKRVQMDLRFDKGQWSRWASGSEGIVWPRLAALMDYCGNDAPVAGHVSRRDLRPDDWHRIWPELIGTDGAPPVPEANGQEVRDAA